MFLFGDVNITVMLTSPKKTSPKHHPQKTSAQNITLAGDGDVFFGDVLDLSTDPTLPHENTPRRGP